MVEATINIYGPGATNALASTWEQAINDYWNNFGKNLSRGACKVVFKITVKLAGYADNHIVVLPSGAPNPYSKPGRNLDGRSVVVGGERGYWYDSATGWTIAHEAGHIFGLFDLYYESGGKSIAYPTWGNTIMATPGAKVDQKTIDLFLDLQGCQC